MDVERPRPPSCHAPRRLPHVHEGDDEVPPRPAGLELRRPVRRAQPDPHAARQVQLGPRSLTRSHADRARGPRPHPPRLVERRRHEGILEDPDRHVTPEACRPRALPVPILVTTVLPGAPRPRTSRSGPRSGSDRTPTAGRPGGPPDSPAPEPGTGPVAFIAQSVASPRSIRDQDAAEAPGEPGSGRPSIRAPFDRPRHRGPIGPMTTPGPPRDPGPRRRRGARLAPVDAS